MRPREDYTAKATPHRTVPEYKKAITELRRRLPNFREYQIRTMAIFLLLETVRGKGTKGIPGVGRNDDVEAKLGINSKEV